MRKFGSITILGLLYSLTNDSLLHCFFCEDSLAPGMSGWWLTRMQQWLVGPTLIYVSFIFGNRFPCTVLSNSYSCLYWWNSLSVCQSNPNLHELQLSLSFYHHLGFSYVHAIIVRHFINARRQAVWLHLYCERNKVWSQILLLEAPPVAISSCYCRTFWSPYTWLQWPSFRLVCYYWHTPKLQSSS